MKTSNGQGMQKLGAPSLRLRNHKGKKGTHLTTRDGKVVIKTRTGTMSKIIHSWQYQIFANHIENQ